MSKKHKKMKIRLTEEQVREMMEQKLRSTKVRNRKKYTRKNKYPNQKEDS